MRTYCWRRITTAAIVTFTVLVAAAPASGQGLLDRLKSVASRAGGDPQGQGWRQIERYVERHKDRDNPLILRPTTRKHRRVEILAASRPGVHAVHEGGRAVPGDGSDPRPREGR